MEVIKETMEAFLNEGRAGGGKERDAHAFRIISCHLRVLVFATLVSRGFVSPCVR